MADSVTRSTATEPSRHATGGDLMKENTKEGVTGSTRSCSPLP